jgi:hypothetical protein
MQSKNMVNIQKAIDYAQKALRLHKPEKAKEALAWVLNRDLKNIEAWLLMAQCIESKDAKSDCYKRVLVQDPSNQAALQGLKELQSGLIQKSPLVSSTSETDSSLEPEDPVAIKLEYSRQVLLDLSLRNKLLNYSPLKSKGLEIKNGDPDEIYELLVESRQSLSFVPIPEASVETLEDGEETDALEQPEEESGTPILQKNVLQTPYKSAVLQKRLRGTYYAARTSIEEQGVNTLYLAIGMLNWYESDSSELVRKSPIVLIPVDLDRSSVHARFKISYSDSDLEENRSLKEKLLMDFGVELPIFSADAFDILEYFSQVKNSIDHFPKWGLDSLDIALGFFSFGKFLMFNDLDSRNWKEENLPYKHPVIRSLFVDGFNEHSEYEEADVNIDQVFTLDEQQLVKDADSSQSLVILDVKNGKNLVVQGPPGTGKSQTITNLIADALGNGKKVLFVSEKMAALEVVKRRLDDVHLGDACLELHSQKTKKKMFLDGLEQSLSLGQPRGSEDIDLTSLKKAQVSLTEYAIAVNTEIGSTGVTPYECYGELLLLRERDKKIDFPTLKTAVLTKINKNQFQTLYTTVKELEGFLLEIGVPKDHPFYGVKKSFVMPDETKRMETVFRRTLENVNVISSSSSDLAKMLGFPLFSNLEEVKNLVNRVEGMFDPPDLHDVNIESNDWIGRSKEIQALLLLGERLSNIHLANKHLIQDASWGTLKSETKQNFEKYAPKWWRSFSGAFRQARKEIKDLCTDVFPSSIDEQIKLIDIFAEESQLRQEVIENDNDMKELFRGQWQGTLSDWTHLKLVSEWLETLHIAVQNQSLPQAIVSYFSANPDLTKIRALIADIQSGIQVTNDSLNNVVSLLELDQHTRFGPNLVLASFSFDQQSSLLEQWASASTKIQEMITYNSLVDNLTKEGLGELCTLATSGEIPRDNLSDVLSWTWYWLLIRKAYNDRSVLQKFDGNLHTNITRNFQKLDREFIGINQIRLAKKHWEKLPRHDAGGQLRVLRSEFSKKRRHLPIRKLIERTGNVIQEIKPIFMMSPLSIAMFLPPESITFDLIIFDEASQVKPIEAMGAIIRGKQVVVVGDTKQLPPTSFFENEIDADEDDDQNLVADQESILGLCYSRGMLSRMLRWHYRSQHESLITVSNREFYDSKLVIYPSPDDSRKNIGLVFNYLPETIYDRGGSSVNRLEARTIAKAVMTHAEQTPQLTLGVAAFSKVQMQAVLDEVEILRRSDSTNELFFRQHPHEPFFVKNLENVQGDERDVIFISVGYGRASDGRLSLNFGALNNEGGERRLNVLITRAKRRCEVFSNFTADDIDLSRTQSRGLQVFKSFLKYAETGLLDLPFSSGREPDSPFEEAVAHKLRECGYEIEHQIGTGGFFIDLAVKDKEHPGRYLLGIECDGATYHSAKSARDRDRLRQEILEEKLGWHIHRIWSTDWFRSSETELKRVIESIGKAKILVAQQDEIGKKEVPLVERDEPSIEFDRERIQPKTVRKNSIEVYQIASLGSELEMYQDFLHEVSGSEWAGWIENVVQVEGPVHRDEVARRIANAAGVKRVGQRIKDAFNKGVNYAVRKDIIKKQGKFLWLSSMGKPTLRTRDGLPPALRKTELVPPEEIELAILQVVLESYGIERDNIPGEACKLLGFSRVSSDMLDRVNGLIDKLLGESRLEFKGSHIVIN